jgi:hypothetical protein
MKFGSRAPRVALCLYGNFNNRLDSESGENGYKYIKSRLIDEYSPDIFIYSSDLTNKERITDLYGSWIAEADFVKPLDFENLISKESGIDSSLFNPLEPFRTLGNTLAFLFNRGESIHLMTKHANASRFDYDWVIVARFDLGQLDKINGRHSHRVSEIGFHPDLASDYIFSAQWQQHNLGLADQWFFSSQPNIEKLARMYDWALGAFASGSDYLNSLSSGIPDSNKEKPFSNEILRIDTKVHKLATVDPRLAINNHLLHKLFFIETDELYKKLRFTSDFGSAANVVYTHSDYSDVWPAFFGQLEKHLGAFRSNYVFVDRISEGIPSHFRQIIYDDKKSYTHRLRECLTQITEKVILFQHEDMILHDTPRAAELVKLIEELDGDAARFDAAKMVSGGSFLHLPVSGHRGFRKIWRQSPWIFSIQPTIWRKSSLERLLALHGGQTIWEFETKAQRTVRKLRLRTLSPKRAKNKRGRYHWDNSIYPVISTAVSKGKWVFSEYESELHPILSNYGIDPSVRGTI